jgi:pimeloyl-ACP methyl ester carboxylesterase
MTTYVLVHGSWHSAKVWQRVTPLLEAAGHRVWCPTLTGYGEKQHLLGPDIGAHTHTQDVVDVLVDNDLTDVVLVGHSYAGLVVAAAASRAPDRVRRLVFLDAMVPADGENAIDIMPVSQILVDAALASESGWRIPVKGELPAPHGLFGVTDPVDVAWLREMLSDQPIRSLQDRVRLDPAAMSAIARTHIHCTIYPEGFHRRPVPAVEPDGSAPDIRELHTGHDCMVTMPRELAEILLGLR